MNERNLFKKFEDQHERYWKEPDKHILTRRSHSGVRFYTIRTVYLTLSMQLCDDLDYAFRPAKTMTGHVVLAFESYARFDSWLKTKGYGAQENHINDKR